ncbi:efflux RND transporter periplasmic adaptor subunit [Tabrizicola sp.]|uniref:efflux RND transporter periplasmic adaptor subunit n=1 Tax=Tabrizicola sp. TaxID=2005166 RepID=UPI00286BB760|nr:efflux RND transporter periplasmic adaptor subunit [Tabrizicola sp.]
MVDKAKTRADPSAAARPDAPLPAKIGQLTVPAVQVPPPPVTPAPQKRSRWIWAGLAALVVVATGLWYFEPWVTKGLPVTVETVAPAPLMRVLAVNGRIAPLHLVDVKPSAGGELTDVLVGEGAAVAKGEVLARLDASGQQAIVRQAMAGLDAGLVGLSQADADLVRAEALGQNVARTALAEARTTQQTATQEVMRLKAVFDQTQIDLEKFTVLAPVAGTVLTRNAEVGQSVDLATPLFSVADLGRLVVETDVDEGYAALITPGLVAVLQLKGDTTKHDGSVSFVAAQVDAATGGLAVKIAFDDPVVAPVGLTVTANIIVDRLDAAIAVPRAAVVVDAAGAIVFVAVAGVAVERTVSIVDWPADRVQITQGLGAGDVVITDATGVSDGLAIIVSPAVPES